ncbi:MAG: ATP-binding protein [Muribaculaceae bacterium]|nr:ATP-binding protein [Muribaculaceae bacterium]
MSKKATTKKKDEKKAKTTKANNIVKMPTLIQAIDKVAEEARDSKFSDEFFLSVAPELGLLTDAYHITERQAALFCICLLCGPYRIDFNDFARHLDVSNICVLSFAQDIDELVRRRLLRFRDAKEKDTFDVPQAVIKCLKRNEAYELPKRTGLNSFQFFEALDEMINDLENDSVSPSDLFLDIKQLMKDNSDIDFVKQFEAQNISRRDNWLLLLWMTNRLINHDDNDFRFGEFEDIYEYSSDYQKARAELRSGEHVLMKANLIEHKTEDGLANTSRIGLTDHAKQTLLSEFKIANREENVSNLLKHADLQEKKLFYNDNMQDNVAEIEALLSPKKYSEIVERMKKSGFRQGFACLFYGAAGTGKTETVYQLARHTGRDIMMVDVPQIKSKWVGDSEKNIKAVFDRYREAVKRCKQAPILLFNEADAIFGVRKNGAENAVDKMENTIQNIILQEMEQLQGILIATTNLECNLDSAFERRFLYKLRFERPDAEIRAKIWQSMIKGLRKNDALSLAEQFDMSGGQIENVARKHTINNILFGRTKKLVDTLAEYCKNEKLEPKQLPRIGFN